MSLPHLRDRDCTVNPETGLCTECRTHHGDPCPECGGRAFHSDPCPILEAGRRFARLEWRRWWRLRRCNLARDRWPAEDRRVHAGYLAKQAAEHLGRAARCNERELHAAALHVAAAARRAIDEPFFCGAAPAIAARYFIASAGARRRAGLEVIP